jgi:hypothetical protein
MEMDYRTLTKSQLIELVNIIESDLKDVCSTSETVEKYATDIQSRLTYEVGLVGRSIKKVLAIIDEYKECSK